MMRSNVGGVGHDRLPSGRDDRRLRPYPPEQLIVDKQTEQRPPRLLLVILGMAVANAIDRDRSRIRRHLRGQLAKITGAAPLPPLVADVLRATARRDTVPSYVAAGRGSTARRSARPAGRRSGTPDTCRAGGSPKARTLRSERTTVRVSHHGLSKRISSRHGHDAHKLLGRRAPWLQTRSGVRSGARRTNSTGSRSTASDHRRRGAAHAAASPTRSGHRTHG